MTKITFNLQDIFQKTMTKNRKKSKPQRLPPMSMKSHALKHVPNISTGFHVWLLH